MPFTATGNGAACALTSADMKCTEQFSQLFGDLAREFARHAWMLLKPTLTLMLLDSLA